MMHNGKRLKGPIIQVLRARSATRCTAMATTISAWPMWMATARTRFCGARQRSMTTDNCSIAWAMATATPSIWARLSLAEKDCRCLMSTKTAVRSRGTSTMPPQVRCCSKADTSASTMGAACAVFWFPTAKRPSSTPSTSNSRAVRRQVRWSGTAGRASISASIGTATCRKNSTTAVSDVLTPSQNSLQKKSPRCSQPSKDAALTAQNRILICSATSSVTGAKSSFSVTLRTSISTPPPSLLTM